MIAWLKILIDVILPPRCLICGKSIHTNNGLCSNCFAKINFISSPYCLHCGRPLPLLNDEQHYCASCLSGKNDFRLCRSAVKYDEYSKKLILDFKFSDCLENKTLLVNWLFLAGQDIFKEGIDLIIPVPLHYTRLFKRKYNQSAVLASGLSALTGISVNYKSLQKVKHTAPQISCSGRQRLKNVKKAFEVVRAEDIKDKRIVLIDDVFTTGATLGECSKALKKAGAKSVDALTIARVCA